MILVLCLNAAVDKTCYLPNINSSGRNLMKPLALLPGGKGINVARALRRLGQKPMILGFTAGATGRWIERETSREGLRARWVRLKTGDSRLCLSLLDGRRHPTDLNELGPSIHPSDVSRLTSAYTRLLGKSRAVVLSGSLPPGAPPSIYARFMRLAHARAKPVFLDASGEPLRNAVRQNPDLLKLNREEAASLGFDGIKDSRFFLDSLWRRGVREAVVTGGPDEACAYLSGKFWRAQSPAIRAVTPIGCGDTFLAGMIHAKIMGWPPEKSFAFAMALATASASVLGAGVFPPRDVPKLLKRVRVRPG